MNDSIRPDPPPKDPLDSLYEELKQKTPGSPTTGGFGTSGQENAGKPPLPTSFGRYQVKMHLGSGGYGNVYLAHDSQLDRPVAVKTFPMDADKPEQVKSFMGEARRVARLRHPGIVSVHDVGVEDVWIYIVSDFLDGPDLAGWLVKNRPAWPEAVRIVADVADALGYAHSKRTVHRDVKPGNILLTAGSKPVLVDFGISLDEGMTGGDELGIVVGTPAYMSPEQVAGEAHRIDGRTDIYSLGVVLYEMLCGRLPFVSENLTELLRQVADDGPQPLRQLVPDLPPEVERICLRAMAKHQNDRYMTASDFAEDLRRVVDGAPEPATPKSRSMGTAPQRPTSKPTSRSREAERRQVTMLVATLEAFESEEFLERLDSEEQADAIQRFQTLAEQAVLPAGGTMIQCNPQGLQVCFGYPVAHEDAARRAARAGLSFLEAIRTFDLGRGGAPADLKPRVALHTGVAIVQAGEETVSVVGEARNVAVRIQERAPIGTLVCSETTHPLISRHFLCESLERHRIKGMATPVEIFAIGDEQSALSPIEARVSAGLSPLTGRDHELSLLKDRWEQALEGMGQVVLLIGEAGLGKSRLVHTMMQHVRGQGPSEPFILEWRCSPQSVNSDLSPAREFFERFLSFERGQSPAQRFGLLRAHLETLQLDRDDVVPFLASLLSLPLDDRFTAPVLSPAREREGTFRALRDWLRACAARSPLLFIIEDLHWLDASTLELLGQVLAEGLRDRVLTLLTFRPEFQTPWPALSHQTSLALNRLTRRQVGELMRGKAGAAPVSDDLVARMHDRTGGIPLFVEEYARMVPASGQLSSEIPRTLQDLVMARLDSMTGEREIVQVAAVLGREFSYELLAAVALQEEATLQAGLSKLVAGELLYPKGRIPRCTYLFKHALLQDAAYASMIKPKRQQYHRRIAEVLEAQFPQVVEAQPELLAHHLTEAGLTEAAIDAWLAAGSKSLGRWAHAEAIGHLRKGLALIPTLDESTDRDGLEMKFLKPQGMSVMAVSGYASADAGAVMNRARELSERIGHPVQHFATLWGVWAWHVVRAEYPLCMTLSDEAMAFSERLGDPGIRMEALFMPALTKFSRGDFSGAHGHLSDALSRLDDRVRTRHWADITGQDSGVAHRCYLALSLWYLGRLDEALKVLRETTELARRIGHPYTEAYIHHHAAWFYFNCRMPAEAAAAAEEESRLADEHGFALLRATSKIFRASALILRNRPAEALPLVLEGIDQYRASGAEMALPFYCLLVARTRLLAGQVPEARIALGEAFRYSEKNDDRFRESELHLLCGELALAESHDAAQAEKDYLKALDVARRQQSKSMQLRSTLALARLGMERGQRDPARQALKDVIATFNEGFGMPDLVDAAALLASPASPAT